MGKAPALLAVISLLTAACGRGATDETTTTQAPSTTVGSTTTGPPATVATTAEPSGQPPPAVPTLGDPAWATEPPMAAGEIDRVYLLEWADEAGAPAACPLLVFADLGEEASDARIRRATNQGEMLVAWDRPSGPGHNGSGEPCADCGRGAVGLGTFQLGTVIGEPITHRWADGSEGAAYAGFYGTEMRLRPAGFDCTYWLWSHLGPDHLDTLLGRLRRVEGYP